MKLHCDIWALLILSRKEHAISTETWPPHQFIAVFGQGTHFADLYILLILYSILPYLFCEFKWIHFICKLIITLFTLVLIAVVLVRQLPPLNGIIPLSTRFISNLFRNHHFIIANHLKINLLLMSIQIVTINYYIRLQSTINGLIKYGSWLQLSFNSLYFLNWSRALIDQLPIGKYLVVFVVMSHHSLIINY